ncbi:MAG: glycoside hydrolase family 43 protein [Christensenellales bacterium]
MKQALLMLLTLCLLIPAARGEAPAQADDAAFQARFYQNPSTVKDIGDPFILAAEGAFWCFGTTGGMGFQVRRSEDLVKWGKPVYAYVPGKDSWADKDYWAPEVFHVNGAYYLFYSARDRDSGSLRVGLARADLPQGPYVDVKPEPLFDFGYAAIDAHLMMDEGQPYLYFARDCSENVVAGRHESHIYVVRLSQDLAATEGEPLLLTRPDQPWEMASGPDWLWNEGPSVIKQGGRYYLYYSANYYASRDYAVGVAVSDSPLGPFRKLGDGPLMRYVEAAGETIVSGPGHNSFFRVGEELFTAYHTHVYPNNPSGYRQMAFDRAGFLADGTPYIKGPTLAPQLLPLALLSLQNHLVGATAQDKASATLSDGSGLVSSSAAAYGWTWEAPVTIDGLILTARGEAEASAYFLLDDVKVPFTLAAGDALPGASLRLSLPPTRISRLSLQWEGSPAPAVFEVVAVGP